MTPRWPLTPFFGITCVTPTKDHYIQVPWKYIKVCGYSDPFFFKTEQRSLTPRWPLTPSLLRSHVWLYPRITVFKSHGNTLMYVDTVISFVKYHILHTTYIHTTYYVQKEWSHSLFLKTDEKWSWAFLRFWPRLMVQDHNAPYTPVHRVLNH